MKRNRFSLRKLLAGIITVAAGLVVFSACKKSNDTTPNTPVAGVMAFNLATNKPAIGISLSGANLLSSPLPYGGYSGAYLSIFPGNRTVDAFETVGTAFASTGYTFEEGKYYSVFVSGANGKYNNWIVKDDVDTLKANGQQSYVRYINAIPDSSKPLVSIKSGSNTLFNNTAAYQSASGFVPVTAGELSIAVNNESNISTSRTITLGEKKVYTVLLMGNPAATDTTAKVQVRFIENGGL
jgi:Domain of unknown function (DUF4397)